MTKTKINHQNTEIYKIVCNDPEVKDLYVGSTTNFVQRKYQHKNSVNNTKNNLKIYKIIRDNGGWKNWKMILVEKYPCSSKREAGAREEKIRIKLQAKMNMCFRSNNTFCLYPDCDKSSRGITNYCVKHGGGKRCVYPDCDKGSINNTDYCSKHGGGKRCVYPDCDKGSIKGTDYCFKHGGGKICIYKDCDKSVQGITDYCIKHGGGKRCIYANCDKSTKGNTDYCVKHGGGKRCVHPDCDKGAQGTTHYCKKHGIKIECECGSIVSQTSLKSHYKTKKHIEYSKQ